MQDFKVFLPIGKVDKEKRTVSGYASTPTQDSDGEIITLKAIKAALPSYMAYANIREMHKLSAVGVAKEANIDPKGLYLTAHIVDDAAWKKCESGVYKGFSIGGQKLAKVGNVITELDLTEISIVDRPANPDCRIDVIKAKKPVEDGEATLMKVGRPRLTKAQALADLTKAAAAAATAEDDDDDNEPEVDLNAGLDLAKAEQEAKDKAEVEAEALTKAEVALKPYGDVTYADEGLRGDGKHRYPIDTEEHIRAAWNYINKGKNAQKYSPEALAKVKAKIVSAWKAKVDPKGPPGAQKVAKAAEGGAGQSAKRDLSFLDLCKAQEPPPVAEPDFLNLTVKGKLAKGLQTAYGLSSAFDTIRSAQRSLMLEGRDEGGDGKDAKMARKLGAIAKDLADLIGQKATHEGGEALDMSDVDDKWVRQSLGKDFNMSGNEDALGKAIMGLLAKAVQPNAKSLIGKAKEDMKEAKKARKGVMADIEKAHSMLKGSFLAKAKKAPDAEEMDEAECMKALASAHAGLQKMAGLEKGIKALMEKAEGMVGEHGQMVQDSDGKFYEVPPGITPLGMAAMAGASPGGTENGGQPPMYPDDGSVYAGKAAGATLRKMAKGGMVSVDQVEALLENERLRAENEVLKAMPATGRQRPHSFDLRKLNGALGDGDHRAEVGAMFKGVDVSAIGSNNESAHNAAVAKATGNFLLNPNLGRSMYDGSFKGGAGGNTH